MEKRRIHLLDELRGFAVVCMVLHHSLLSIADIFRSQFFMDAFNFLCYFQPIIWLVFFGVSGISSSISENNLKRGGKLFGIALVITAVTFGYFNGKMTIVFGALHFLAVSMMIYHFIKPLIRKINPLAGIVVCFLLFAFTYEIYRGYVGVFDFVQINLPRALYRTDFLFWLGFPSAGFMSADYFPLLPYIFLFLIGTFVGTYVERGRIPAFAYKKRSSFLRFMGKNALIVYIAHQPIIYAICYVVKWLV
ncbi:MAG: DUF1624 domain-containing protein [Clostridia bacterium]|nr:DUF1624 domain-containing protein [Clostridia bacterium]